MICYGDEIALALMGGDFSVKHMNRKNASDGGRRKREHS